MKQMLKLTWQASVEQEWKAKSIFLELSRSKCMTSWKTGKEILRELRLQVTGTHVRVLMVGITRKEKDSRSLLEIKIIS